MFYWSSNPLNVFLILPNYDFTSKSNLAANMAAVQKYYSNSVHSYPRDTFGVYCKVIQVAEYTGTTPTAIGWLCHC